MHIEIDDQLLIRCMPQAEQRLLAQIPQERELHHSFSARFRWQMRALCRYERRSPRMRAMVHSMKVAAAVFAIVLTLMFGTLMSVEAARVQMFRFFTKVYTELTSVQVSVREEYAADEVIPVDPKYIPQGYQVKYVEKYPLIYKVFYEDLDGNEIIYTQMVLSASEMIFDTEDAYTETIVQGDTEYHVIIKDGLCQLFCNDEKNMYFLSGQIKKDELIKMMQK